MSVRNIAARIKRAFNRVLNASPTASQPKQQYPAETTLGDESTATDRHDEALPREREIEEDGSQGGESEEDVQDGAAQSAPQQPQIVHNGEELSGTSATIAMGLDEAKSSQAEPVVSAPRQPPAAETRAARRVEPTSPDEYEKYQVAPRDPVQPEISKLVPYVLHSALPHASNGYAIRSHGLITALHRLGWDVVGMTQPGFGRPRDEVTTPDPETGLVPPMHLEDEVEGVIYRHLNDPVQTPSREQLTAFTDDFASRIQRELDGKKPLLIHAASNLFNGLAAVAAANAMGIASVYEVRGLWEVSRRGNQPQFFYHPYYHHTAELETLAAREATYCIAISEQLKEELIFRGVPEDRIFVAPNGTDPNRHTPQEVDLALAEQLGLQEKFVVGYVGSIVTYEGLDLLIEAANMLRLTLPNLHVLIVGDGENLPRLRNLVRFLDLDDRVTLTGRVSHDEVGRYSSLIDLVVLPRSPLMVSDLVPALKPFEAMAQERPVLVSDVATMNGVITDGANGFLFRRGDARALARKIAELERDREALVRVGKYARQWVIENRTWMHSAQVIAEVYERIWEESQEKFQRSANLRAAREEERELKEAAVELTAKTEVAENHFGSAE